MKLATYRCEQCGEFEELVDGEPTEHAQCPNCGDCDTERVLFSPPSSVHTPLIAKVMMQGSLIRQRWLGKLPWRKSSESQSD